ncbi:TetR/AcrR family transcriptional regulator [Gordonia sp. DT219]|uniref:TetR/AcrR family transcriptional regulator n=1 Tax=Gordonia sp. DT219 TaxID=3416658 RepID=UPI003CF12E3E
MLRTDARDNRDQILAAARTLFTESGLQVTMRQIARRAAVGPATLYRRFPTKQILIDEAFADELRTCRQIVDDGCAHEDPWRGFCGVIERLIVLNAQNQGFVDAFTSSTAEMNAIAAHRVSMIRKLTALTARAQAMGGLRHDFVIDDVVLILLAGRGLATLPQEHRARAATRFAAVAVSGLRQSEDNVALPQGSRMAAAVILGGTA